MNTISKYVIILFFLVNNLNKLVNCLNASEIDSFVLLHDRVKNTLIEIAINGRCDSPKPTVVYVNETKDKLYLPRATILYRCSDQFACCPNPRHSCMASDEEEVDIGFYTLTKTEDQITERSIEILKFNNHTKCSCRRKDSQISKDILLGSDSTIRELQKNSTFTETKTTVVLIQSRDKSSKNPIFIEKHFKTEKKTKILTEVNSSESSTNTKPKNMLSTTIKPLITKTKLPFSSISKAIVPFNRTTKPTFLIIKNSSKSTLNGRTTESILKISSDKPMLTTKSTTKRFPKPITKSIPIVTTIRTTIHSKVKENEKNLNSITTPDEMTNKNTDKVVSTTPLTTSQVNSKGTLVPLIRSSINYDELEREEDIKPEEDVIFNNANGFDLFYTNGIFFRPLTTTPYRSHRSIEKVTKKCG